MLGNLKVQDSSKIVIIADEKCRDIMLEIFFVHVQYLLKYRKFANKFVVKNEQ